MTDKRPLQTEFDKAVNRREYEKSRLDEDLKKRVERAEEGSDARKAAWLARREEERERNVSERVTELYQEHPVLKLTPEGSKKPYVSAEDVRLFAEQDIDAATRRGADLIDLSKEKVIDRVLEKQAHRDCGRQEAFIGRDFSNASRGLHRS